MLKLKISEAATLFRERTGKLFPTAPLHSNGSVDIEGAYESPLIYVGWEIEGDKRLFTEARKYLSKRKNNLGDMVPDLKKFDAEVKDEYVISPRRCLALALKQKIEEDFIHLFTTDFNTEDEGSCHEEDEEEEEKVVDEEDEEEGEEDEEEVSEGEYDHCFIKDDESETLIIGLSIGQGDLATALERVEEAKRDLLKLEAKLLPKECTEENLQIIIGGDKVNAHYEW